MPGPRSRRATASAPCRSPRAARAGHRALVELFLAAGAGIDARNLVGATALYAAAENDRQPIVALLLAKGADPNLPGRSDVPPLAAAAYKGNDTMMAALLTHGATPDAEDGTGKTPIVYGGGARLHAGRAPIARGPGRSQAPTAMISRFDGSR